MREFGLGVLDGVRVADFGRYISGPYCASLLADFGADVIRVEDREGAPDRFVVPLAPRDAGASFLATNRNKKSLGVDTRTEEGREIRRRLIASSDIVVVNLPPQTLEAMELDYPS